MQPIVLFGQNAELKAGETAEAVVVIGGSAKIHGHVREAVVVIGGDLEVDGEVGEAVVAIFGNVHVKPGAIDSSGCRGGLGTVSAAPGVKIGGDAVAVGGKLDLADGAIVNGQKVSVGFPGPFANFGWLRDWFKYCVLESRPLSLKVGFVWVIAAVFFLIYLLDRGGVSAPRSNMRGRSGPASRHHIFNGAVDEAAGSVCVFDPDGHRHRLDCHPIYLGGAVAVRHRRQSRAAGMARSENRAQFRRRISKTAGGPAARLHHHHLALPGARGWVFDIRLSGRLGIGMRRHRRLQPFAPGNA